MSNQPNLRLVSYLAPNMFWFYEAVGSYLSRKLGIETQIVQSQVDPLLDPTMLQDQVDIAFICGLPFVQLNRILSNQLIALVAPVMKASRYQNCPVYFSDIIVNANSNLMSFEQLRSKTLCYNEPGSNSGYNLLRQRLIQSGYPRNFFGKLLQSGSHQRSIQLVADGIADCSAIDSTVLEQELRNFPELSNCLRVIDSIGPCPMPPVVAAKRLGSTFIELLKYTLCQLDTWQLAMNQANIQCYLPVKSEDYAVIGQIYDKAVETGYELCELTA